jgi:uncharacterized protein YndB with AHSA1/START domain
MTDATLVTGGTRPAVRLERILKDPPVVVWRALTEPEELARWFPCEIQVEGGVWRTGAKLRFPFPADVIDLTLEGEVLEADEPRSLAYTWGDETLRFELHAHDGGTRMVLIDELDAAHAARNGAGWMDCLDRLEGNLPAKDAWRAHFDELTASFEPVLGAQEGPPAGYKGG